MDGIKPGSVRCRPRFVEVVDMWKELVSGDETWWSPRATEPRRCVAGQLLPYAERLHDAQSTIYQPVGLESPHLAGRYRPVECQF